MEAAPTNAQGFANPWQWMCPPWKLRQQYRAAPCVLGGHSSSGPYPGPWMQSLVFLQDTTARTVSPDSAARLAWRHKKHVVDEVVDQRVGTAQKPNQVWMMIGGEIDGGCEGKNAWDLAIHTFVPRMLDLEVIDRDNRKPEAVCKLQGPSDAEFDYLGYPLRIQGFMNAIT